MPDAHVNAIIGGAGAGGGVVAKELSEAGLSVLLIERGGWPQFEELGHDELSAQSMGPVRNAYGPDDARHRRVIKTGDGSWRTVVPSEAGYGVIAANVGSGTATYGAMAWRFMPQDFRMRTTYGCPEGSTLDDWPITYDELEPFYVFTKRRPPGEALWGKAHKDFQRSYFTSVQISPEGTCFPNS
jgi:choline dehydrogenase-like flavoprotein